MPIGIFSMEFLKDFQFGNRLRPCSNLKFFTNIYNIKEVFHKGTEYRVIRPIADKIGDDLIS